MGTQRMSLRVARATVEISQLELGRQSGLTEKVIWAIENGYRVPTPAEREAITAVLGIAAIAWPTKKGTAHGDREHQPRP